MAGGKRKLSAKQTKKKPAAKKPVAKKFAAAKVATRPRRASKAPAKKAAAKPRRVAKPTIDAHWAALVKELATKEKARDAIDPFRKGWVSSDKQIAVWKELNDAVKDVRERMDRYMAGFSHS